MYEIRQKIYETKQAEMTIAQYFAKHSSLWQKLNYYQDFHAECPEDTTKFQKLMEKERIYEFLAAFNLSLIQSGFKCLEEILSYHYERRMHMYNKKKAEGM